MSPRVRVILSCGLVALASRGLGAQGSVRALEAVEAYLTKQGLDAILVLHLEERLEHTDGSARADLASRLAEVYARVLARETDDARRDLLQERSAALLRDVPDAQSLALRLSLAQTAYARAESLAERWRIGRATQAEADSAKRIFTDLQPQLASIAENANSRIVLYERDEERSGGSEFITRALSEARRHRSMANFLAGWCGAYVAELDPSVASGAAATGLRHFGVLLDARPGAAPTVSRVKRGQLRFEHIARAAIGAALCESIRGNHVEALDWLDRLGETNGLPDSVGDQLLARRLIVLSRADRWGQIAALVHRRTTSSVQDREPEGLTLTESRLLAVLALEGARESSRTDLPRSMAQIALASIAVEGQIGQLVDLIDPYLALVRDDQGAGVFLASYLRGIREYERARAEHTDSGAELDQPASSSSLRQSYEDAARFLSRAIDAEDADRFHRALPGAMLLEALAQYYAASGASDLERAADGLTRAAQALGHQDAQRAGGAFRLAVMALELASRRDASRAPALAQKRRAVVEQFLERHRDHPAAAAFLYQRATEGSRSVRDAVADLLSIPSTSDLASPAYHEAARLLYREFTDATSSRRERTALEFLGVAERLLARDRAQILAGDVTHHERAALNARRILDVELSLSTPNVPRLSLAFDLLETLRNRELLADPAAHAELRYRAVQLALLRGRFEEAERAASALAQSDPNLASNADRLLFNAASARWRQLRAEGDTDGGRAALLETSRRALGYGARVLDGLDDTERDLGHVPTFALMTTIAEIGAYLWFTNQEQAAANMAIRLLDQLREAYPFNTSVLETAAALHQSLGRTEDALECYRGLLAGYDAGSDPWFDAKVQLLEILTDSDASRAREILEQHEVLYPDLGPEPFRSRLERIKRRLHTPEESS